MDTFKQFLQRKAATKRAELADIDAQAKHAEADEQRKKANAARPIAKFKIEPVRSKLNQ